MVGRSVQAAADDPHSFAPAVVQTGGGLAIEFPSARAVPGNGGMSKVCGTALTTSAQPSSHRAWRMAGTGWSVGSPLALRALRASQAL
mmetsp:Transcript_12333/g.43449  ORF Transcript_12333/g.43449 Transcript_12333/m.43449 type:complete len:88 (-) Transcript_12333:238-501(-)